MLSGQFCASRQTACCMSYIFPLLPSFCSTQLPVYTCKPFMVVQHSIVRPSASKVAAWRNSFGASPAHRHQLLSMPLPGAKNGSSMRSPMRVGFRLLQKESLLSDRRSRRKVCIYPQIPGAHAHVFFRCLHPPG